MFQPILGRLHTVISQANVLVGGWQAFQLFQAGMQDRRLGAIQLCVSNGVELKTRLRQLARPGIGWQCGYSLTGR